MKQKKMESKPKYGDVVETPFRHTYPVQLRFNDVDVLGHVNNSIYFALFDLGKSRYFSEVRGEGVDWQKADIVIANVNCNFLAQTYYDEPIAVQTQTVKLGEKSIKLVQRLINTSTDEVKAQCSVVMVSFDIATGKSKPLADHWRTAIQQFEGRAM